MLGSEAIDFLKLRLFGLVLLTGACKYLFGSYLSLPGVFLTVAFLAYTNHKTATTRTPTSESDDVEKKISKIVGKLAALEDEITQLAQALDRVQGLIEACGDMVERTGTRFLESFRQIHQQHRDQLRQYNEFRKEHDEKLGSVDGTLDDRRTEISEVSRTVAQNYSLLCNLIAQYQRDVENNQSTVQQHIDSVNTILLGQDEAIKAIRQDATKCTGSIQTKLDGYARAAEDNKKLVKEYGASVNRVVSDHTQLVAEYQVALDGMVTLHTANRVFSLVHVPCGWETLGNIAEDVEDPSGLLSGAQPASMVDNVKELSRTFRGISNRKVKATTPETMDPMLATVLSQVQVAVQAQHTKEAGQLRKAQEDIEKLRADLGEVEEFRRAVREREELERMIQVFRDDPQRINQDAKFRAEVDEMLGDVEERKRAAGASSPGKTA